MELDEAVESVVDNYGAAVVTLALPYVSDIIKMLKPLDDGGCSDISNAVLEIIVLSQIATPSGGE